jgi:hypothetical protein
VSVGVLGETARKALHGDRVTYGRVCEVRADELPADRGQAGEVRLLVRPDSPDDAVARVRFVARFAAGVPFTAFSLDDLLDLVGGDHMALVDLAQALRGAGLHGVAEVPLDALDDAVEVVRAVQRAGLGAWRATIHHAAFADRLPLIEAAWDLQQQTQALKAFAPLPRGDSRETPSTGYDDVRTIVLARVMCPNIPLIQVDWAIYGPKLAQVAIAYGVDDLDGISPLDTPDLGPRRSPREDIERQIKAAGASPATRNGRYEITL